MKMTITAIFTFMESLMVQSKYYVSYEMVNVNYCSHLPVVPWYTSGSHGYKF